MTLTDFLLARIAEDEAAAQRSSTEPPRRYPDAYTKEHVARWDPARVLAECGAKRLILVEHARLPSGLLCRTCESTVDTVACPTLRFLALPYTGHPDYRDEWRT